MRKWVMTYFNPDTDLSVIKSQAHLGQGFEHEMKTTKKFKIGKYFYKLIPESPPLLGKHFRSCAVVGNSGILLDSGCGPQIDSADFVFRSNLAAIEGLWENSEFKPKRPSTGNSLFALAACLCDQIHMVSIPRTVEAAEAKFNTSEVERIRKWVMTYFNPGTDLTVIKSQVKIGQLIRYEVSRKAYANITENFFRLIPESSPLLRKHFRSCAVVGNSGILLDSGCGPQIDSADFVFRCNLAPIEGFENDVGTKSNFTTMNPSVLNHDYKGCRENNTSVACEMFVKRLRLIQDQILHISAFTTVNGRRDVELTNSMILEHHLPIKASYAPVACNYEKNESVSFHFESTVIIILLWKNSEFKLKRPSTGTILFVLSASLCDQIHLYGFYPFSKDKDGRKIKYHYYGSVRNLRNHNMTEEYRAFQTLHQRKALVLHTDPCHDDKL
ncbi:ST8SIA4 [Branchiostoma lanceolatum]|uniref:ST8SIA4 protein n=1 Tax=Branchiostoma lanceolatum TaxID=7740 RepID=A0A8K0EII9_BRALA|nr:ST8SIA4 [Branchiostoma lanceolatum]